MRGTMTAMLAAALVGLAAPALALDLNGFRRQHKLPPLHYSAKLAGAAQDHAYDMARRKHLDHDGFRRRAEFFGSTAAENVLYGCATEACAIRVWANSAGHRRNMLMRGVTHYGIASADADGGPRYWVMELGN